MKETTLYLHWGAHKTATTSLQTYLRQNTRLLRKHDMTWIPHEELNSQGILGFLHGGRKNLANEAGSHRRFFEKTVEQATTTRFLISHESFFSFAGNPRKERIYPTLENGIERFQHVNVFDEVKTLFYFRDPSDFVQSLYIQNLGIVHSDPFNSYVREIDFENLSWLPLVEVFATKWGDAKTTWKLFERIKTQGPAWYLRDYLDWLGVVAPERAALETTNESLSLVATKMIQASGLTHANTDPAVCQMLRAFLQKNFPAIEYGKASLLSDDLKQRIRERLLTDNQVLFDRVFDPSELSLWGY